MLGPVKDEGTWAVGLGGAACVCPSYHLLSVMWGKKTGLTELDFGKSPQPHSPVGEAVSV